MINCRKYFVRFIGLGPDQYLTNFSSRLSTFSFHTRTGGKQLKFFSSQMWKKVEKKKINPIRRKVCCES